MIDREERGDATGRVRLEILGLLGRASEVDLASIYRTLIRELGSDVVPIIGAVIARLVRDGAVEIDTPRLTDGGPRGAVARLILAVAPPYEALVA